MIRIRKNPPPPEFEQWRLQNSDATWEDLPGDIKEALRKSLCKEQGYICAYCMRQITDDEYDERYHRKGTKIEHVLPRKGPNARPDLMFAYHNLVAVCGGRDNRKSDGKATAQTCDAKKGDGVLEAIDPLDSGISGPLGVSYDLRLGLVKSEDPRKRRDIEDVLNLNGKTGETRRRHRSDRDYRGRGESQLVNDRAAAWDRIHKLAQKELKRKGDKAALRWFEDKLRQYESAKPKAEFAGVAIYYLKRRIKALK